MPDELRHPPSAGAPESGPRVAWIERSVLVLLFVGLFIGVIAIVKPFTTAILFGAAVATAAWPARQALVRRGISRGLAAALLLVLSLLLIVLPLLAVAPNLGNQMVHGAERAQAYFASKPEHPVWIQTLPLVGPELAAGWDRVVEVKGNLRALVEPYTADLGHMMVAAARGLADSLVQILLSLIVATMFWANGEALVTVLHDALRRLGGPIAEQALDVAAGAIRGVAYGVVGTALIQAVLLAIGLAVAGVPGATMLGFVGLLLAISQIGAPLLILIWGGAAWWLFVQDHQTWGMLMIIWGIVISMMDHILKPWLIGFGVEMPMSLTMLGVFGGFIAFGFLGLFIGPTLIAIMFTLIQAWRTAISERAAAERLKPVA
jgi:predicted PurR-regulated permease PerM